MSWIASQLDRQPQETPRPAPTRINLMARSPRTRWPGGGRESRDWSLPNSSFVYSPLSPFPFPAQLARHECGTKICREKGIEYARRLLGHANISTTQRYMHLDERELADAQDLVEPLFVSTQHARFFG